MTVTQLRNAFLSGRRAVAAGTDRDQLIVRIINKSHLMYYGRADRNCECPYKVRGHEVSTSVCCQVRAAFIVRTGNDVVRVVGSG